MWICTCFNGKTVSKALFFLNFTVLFCLFLPGLIFFKCGQLHAAEKISTAQNQDIPAQTNRSLKTIIVDNYYPYTYINSQGKPEGFTIDLIKAVAGAMNLDLDIQVDYWNVARDSLASGEIDFLPMMAYSKDRDRHFDFSTPHTIAFDAIFTRKNTDRIKTLSDLRDKKIIVMAEDQAHDYLKQIEFISADQLFFTKSIPEALLYLSSGEGDAALIPKLVGLVRIKKMQLINLELSPIIIENYTRPFSFAVKAGNQHLLERLTQGLVIIKENGQYDSVYNKWFRAYEPLDKIWKKLLRYFFWSLGLMILACFILLLWSVSLKKKVALRTRNLEEEISIRRKAQMDLQRARDRLEQRVMERTSELREANRLLNDEVKERIQVQEEREILILDLQNAIENIKQLSGLLPICANCKKIRDDKGYWNKIESYIETHTEAVFSHGVCPACMEELYGNQAWYIKGNRKKNLE